MKIHSGVDVGGGYVHIVTETSTNKHDITETANLVREDEVVVYGDYGYLVIEKRKDIKSHNNLLQVDFRINKWPSQNKITVTTRVSIGTNRLKTASHRHVVKLREHF